MFSTGSGLSTKDGTDHDILVLGSLHLMDCVLMGLYFSYARLGHALPKTGEWLQVQVGFLPKSIRCRDISRGISRYLGRIYQSCYIGGFVASQLADHH